MLRPGPGCVSLAGGWALLCVTQCVGNVKRGLSPGGIHWGGEGKVAQSGGSLNVCWLSRLPLQWIGREASPQDRSCFPCASRALKSADSELVSLRERKFSSWVSQLRSFSSNVPFCFRCYTAVQEPPLFPRSREAPRTLPQEGRMKAGVHGWEEEEETKS